MLVTDAYNRRCAVTGERTLPVLQAAHIKPYAESGPNRVSNGLLLRSDLHILFDRGYVTINRDYRLEVSPRIREEFENGRQYYAMAGDGTGGPPGSRRGSAGRGLHRLAQREGVWGEVRSSALTPRRCV